MNVLALDVGTSSVKAAVLEQAGGRPLAPPAKAEYGIDRPTPEAAEIPPDRFWGAIDRAAREAVAAAGAEVEGVGLSCLTPALVLLDSGDSPLSPIWIHLDRRSRPVARRVWERDGQEFLDTVGTRPLPGGTSALCFAQQIATDRTLRGRVRHYLHANSWVGLRLTGERRFDPANASFSGLFGTLTDRQWSPRWCDYFGVDPGWLPEVVDGRTTLGGLRAEVAAAWGLKAGVPVKLGTADTTSAMLAAGCGPDDLLHSVGTTQVLAVRVEKPEPDARRLTRLFGVGDGYVYVAHNPVGGAGLEWMHSLCYRELPAEEFYAKAVPEAGKRRSTVALDPPFLGGDRLEIEERVAAFRGLTLGAGRDDLLAAVVSAMRTGHRNALDAIERDVRSLSRIVLTGGGAEAVRQLLPEYASARVEMLDQGSLRGVTRLFDPS